MQLNYTIIGIAVFSQIKNLLLLQTGGGGYLIYLVWVFSTIL